MSLTASFFDHIAQQGDQLHARVLSRDDAHLNPTRLTKAAASRLRTGIAALEAWIRRVLILMALEFEPELKPGTKPWVKTHRPRLTPRSQSLRIFGNTRDPHRDLFDELRQRHRPQSGAQRPVRAAPLLARLSALKVLIDAPEARAKRLAFHMARKRPGRLRPPTYKGRTSGWLFGTEASALFDAMAAAIWERSRARPPTPRPRHPRRPPRANPLNAV